MFGGPRHAGAEPRRDLSQLHQGEGLPRERPDRRRPRHSSAAHGAGQTIGVSYAFRALPEHKGYKPRLADERVGYFTTVRQDWNAKHTDRENLVRYVNRWDLKKKDPTLELSPPEKPIVFVIEKTVPLQWRKYVARGHREWNKAYEQIGIVDAIVVQQQTDDNEFADVDPEDARYNFLRWVVTGNAFAMGPSRADPRTGQILDADIIFDDAMLRYFAQDFDVFGPGTVSADHGPGAAAVHDGQPRVHPRGREARGHEAGGRGHRSCCASATRPRWQGPSQPRARRARQPTRRARACTYATGLRHQLADHAPGHRRQRAGQEDPRALHRRGDQGSRRPRGRPHARPAAQLQGVELARASTRSSAAATPPTSRPFASVMDYNPLLFFPGDDPEKVRHFISPCIGPYDYWAVEYGYKIAGQGRRRRGEDARGASRRRARSASWPTRPTRTRWA